MKKIMFVVLLAFGILTMAACATRRNAPPEFQGVNTNPVIQVGDEYDPLEGVTATDREDGNLTANIEVLGWDEDDVNFPGTYEIVLSVTDSEGAITRVTIYLTIEGEEVALPVLSGVRSAPIYYIGSGTYSPLTGVTAMDEIDGDLTEEIDELGNYDLTTPGVYTIRLRVENSEGGRVTVTIVLTVVDPGIPTTLTTDPITITMWHAMGEANTELMRGYADSFMLMYPNINVEIAEGTGDYNTLRSNMINAITAGTFPNMVQGYPDHVAEYLNGNVVVNLDPYIHHDTWGMHGADAFDDIILSYRQENSQYDLNGTFYSLPFNKSTEVMIYNSNVFAELELDPPTTWQELLAIAPLLKAKGDEIAEAKVRADNPDDTEAQLAPKIAQAKSLVVPASYDSTGNAFITFTRQFGGAYTGVNYETRRGQYLWVDNANTTAAMNFLKNNNNYITLPEFWDQNYASVPFVNQQTFVTVGSSAGVRYNIPGGFGNATNPLGIDFQIGVAPIPYNADMPENKAVIQQGTNVSLLKKGTAQEQLATWMFLKHLINTENTIHWAMNTGYLPVRVSGYEHPDYQAFLADLNDPIALAAQAAYLQSGYMFYDPAFVGSSRARQQVGLALERIILGDGNIASALQDAYNEANLAGD